MRLSRFAALLVLSTAIVPSVGLAQVSDADKATARELTLQGYDALKKGDNATAADRFARADKLFHAPTITVGLAKANLALGKLVAAYELFSRAAHESVPPDASAAFTNAVQQAQQELAALTPRVPGVIINVTGPENAQVTVDDTPVPSAAFGVKRPVDPGKHVIRGLAPGYSPAEVTVTLAEGGAETVKLELKPGPGGPPLAPPPVALTPAGPGASGVSTVPPPPPPDPGAKMRRTIGFVGIGLGGAGVLVGAIAGGLALSKHGDIAAECPNSHCPMGSEMKIQPDINTYQAMGNASTGGLIAGGVLAATGIILVVTAPRAPDQTGWAPVIGPGYAGVQGKF
jgi:hypothetical protein